jgi:hypothetical protein
MSLRSIIAKHGASYTVTRAGAGAITTGRYVPAATTTATMIAVIQPVTGRLLESLPEGQSADETRVCFTEYALRTRTPAGAADLVTFQSEQWAVYQVEMWEGLSGSPHYRAMLSRQTSGGSPL